LVVVKLHAYFTGLLDRAVNINADRLCQLDDHVAALKEFLRGDEGLSPIIRRFVPQGSWAQRTIVRPLPGQQFDADVLVEIKQQKRWAEDPRQYLLAVHDALTASARYRSRAELKTRCVRVVYANDCHVDLVPYLHTSGWFERHEIVNRAENSFEEVNPSGFTEWMRGRDRLAAGNLRKTIRLLKYLRDYKQTFTVPSVILTVIVGSRVSWWRSQLLEGYTDLPTAFTRLVTDTDRWLQERPDLPEIADPSCPQARFDHRLTQRGYGNFRDRFHGYAETIRAAYDIEDRGESLTLWRRVFGDEFAPAP
jgi:hypothetical protein